MNWNIKFTFSKTSDNATLKSTVNEMWQKAFQSSGTTAKVSKLNKDFFIKFISKIFY